MTLYDSIGGEPVLEIAVDKFYGKVMADPLLRLYFKDTDLVSLKRRFQKYLTYLLTGKEEEYKGPSVYEAHVGRRITDEAADIFLEKFKETLVDLGVLPSQVEEIGQKLAPMKDVVVDKVVFSRPHVYKPDSATERTKTA